jgi:hypothetical protein
MPLYTENGLPLVVDGKLAMGEDCCCDDGCCDIYDVDFTVGRTSSLDTINITAETDCDSLFTWEILVNGAVTYTGSLDGPGHIGPADPIEHAHDPSSPPTYRGKIYCNGVLIYDSGDFAPP